MNSKKNQPQVKSNEDADSIELRHSSERRTRKDVSYQYEITLVPKPERRDSKERRAK